MDARCELAHLGQSTRQLGFGRLQQRRVPRLLAEQLEGDPDGEQPLLGAVVQVSLQPGPCLVGRRDDARP